MIGMTMLKRHFEIGGERHGRICVKAIDHPLGAAVVAAIARVSVTLKGERGMRRAERIDGALPVAPSTEKVVLGARATKGRCCPVVDEHHVVALAPPLALVLNQAQRHPHIMSGAFGLERDVILLAVQVFRVVDHGVAV